MGRRSSRPLELPNLRNAVSTFEVISFLLVAAGLAGWLNARWFHLPPAVMMLLAGLAAAGSVAVATRVAPESETTRALLQAIRTVDFSEAVLGYVLAFLMFAGAMQVDLGELRRRRVVIWSLATLGVVVSTALVGLGVWIGGRILGADLSLPWCLVFGALISPTDPVAVLAAVARGGLSKRLQAVLQGEALFNDGVGIVIFTAALAFATGATSPNPLDIGRTVVVEALGGLALGVSAALVIVRAMRAIDEFVVEVTLSLALAAGVYTVAHRIGVSGPIAAAAAGLVIGDAGLKTAMSDLTQRYVRGFWLLVDEILNAAVFLLVGLELLVVPFQPAALGLGVWAIVLTLFARLLVVAPWGLLFRRRGETAASRLMAWGGLHGALSLALALTVEESSERSALLTMAYVVVLFSVLVQGLTFPALVARLTRAQAGAKPSV